MYFNLYSEVIMTVGKSETMFYNLLNQKKKVTKLSNESIHCIEAHKFMSTLGEDEPKLVELCKENYGYWSAKKIHTETITTNKKSMLKTDIIPKRKLAKLSISITDECELNCSFCKLDYSVYSSCTCQRFPNKEMKILSFNEWKEIFVQAQNLGISECQIIGGNPLKEKDLLESILLFLNSRSIGVTIITNGLGMDERFIKLVAQTKTKIRLQVMSLDAYRFERICGFNKLSYLQNSLELMKKFTIDCTADIIITKLNDGEVPAITKTIENLGFNTNRLYVYKNNEYFSEKSMTDMMNPINREMPIDLYSFPFVSEYNNCLYGRLFIDRYGNVSSCPKLRREIFGIVPSETLSSIYSKNNHKTLWEIPKRKVEHCNKCERNIICFDCRALDSFYTKKEDGMAFCSKI